MPYAQATSTHTSYLTSLFKLRTSTGDVKEGESYKNQNILSRVLIKITYFLEILKFNTSRK